MTAPLKFSLDKPTALARQLTKATVFTRRILSDCTAQAEAAIADGSDPTSALDRRDNAILHLDGLDADTKQAQADGAATLLDLHKALRALDDTDPQTPADSLSGAAWATRQAHVASDDLDGLAPLRERLQQAGDDLAGNLAAAERMVTRNEPKIEETRAFATMLVASVSAQQAGRDQEADQGYKQARDLYRCAAKHSKDSKR